MPRLSFLLFAFNFLIFVSSSAQERPTVTKDSNGHLNVTFPTVPGRLYNLEAAPDGVNFAPVPGKWLYVSPASPTGSLSLAQGPDFSLFFDPQTYNPLPAAPTQHAFLRLFLGETNTSTGLTQVSYALYFLNEPGPGGLDTQLYEYAFYSAHSYLYEIFQEDKLPPGSPQGSGIPYGPLLAGSVQLALPSATLLNDRLNGGTIPLTKIVPNGPSHITWHLQVQVHPTSAMTMLEWELSGINSSVTPNTDAHTKTAALLTQTDLAQTLLGNLANTTPGTPPEINPPTPGSLEGARLRIRSHPAHLLHVQIPDDWFYANGYAQAFTIPSLFDPNGDDDGDGLSNLNEFFQGTNPHINDGGILDLDGDGLNGFEEVEKGTNPLLFDTDQDGFSDFNDPEPLNHNFDIPPNSPYISEIMAMMSTGGDDYDWIEIHNPTNQPINLSGWILYNNDDKEWEFPDGFTINSNQYLIIRCDDLDTKSINVNFSGTLHTNFKLKDQGEYLALRNKNGKYATQFIKKYSPLSPNQTFGVSSDGQHLGILSQPTPGSGNSSISVVTSSKFTSVQVPVRNRETDKDNDGIPDVDDPDPDDSSVKLPILRFGLRTFSNYRMEGYSISGIATNHRIPKSTNVLDTIDMADFFEKLVGLPSSYYPFNEQEKQMVSLTGEAVYVKNIFPFLRSKTFENINRSFTLFSNYDFIPPPPDTSGELTIEADYQSGIFQVELDTASNWDQVFHYLVIPKYSFSETKSQDLPLDSWTYLMSHLRVIEFRVPAKTSYSNWVEIHPDYNPIPWPLNNNHFRLAVDLLPINIVNKFGIPTRELKVAKLSKEGVFSFSGNSITNLDFDKEPDRFYIKIPGAGHVPGIHNVKLLTKNNNPIYDDPKTKIDLAKRDNDLVSKSQILVADVVDDDYPIGSDESDQDNDRSHLVQLDGKVKVEDIVISGQEYHPKNALCRVPVKYEIDVEYIISSASWNSPTFPMDESDPIILKDILNANERLAQVGVKANFKFAGKRMPPKGAGSHLGLIFNYNRGPIYITEGNPSNEQFLIADRNLTAEEFNFNISSETERYLFKMGNPSVAPIQVFYIHGRIFEHKNGFLFPDAWGFATPTFYSPLYIPNPSPNFRHNIVLDSRKSLYPSSGIPPETLMAHEIGHLITNYRHAHVGQVGCIKEQDVWINLMSEGDIGNESKLIDGRKRLTEKQQALIDANIYHYLKK